MGIFCKREENQEIEGSSRGYADKKIQICYVHILAPHGECNHCVLQTHSFKINKSKMKKAYGHTFNSVWQPPVRIFNFSHKCNALRNQRFPQSQRGCPLLTASALQGWPSPSTAACPLLTASTRTPNLLRDYKDLKHGWGHMCKLTVIIPTNSGLGKVIYVER